MARKTVGHYVRYSIALVAITAGLTMFLYIILSGEFHVNQPAETTVEEPKTYIQA